MTQAKQIMKAIEAVAPIQLQEDYDNAGLQCGNPCAEVNRVLCCMDVTERIIDEAKEKGCQMIVSHHPLIFRGLKKISPEGDYISRCVFRAISEGIVLYAAHTNLDNAPEGVNMKMVEKLALKTEGNISALEPVPGSRLSGLADDFAKECGGGKVFTLAEPMNVNDFKSLVAKTFTADSCNTNNDYDFSANRLIRKVALCGGAGGFLIPNAERLGADAFITGEIGYHHMFGHPDICLIELGHWESEQYTVELLCDIINNKVEGVEVEMSEVEKPVKHVEA